MTRRHVRRAVHRWLGVLLELDPVTYSPSAAKLQETSPVAAGTP